MKDISIGNICLCRIKIENITTGINIPDIISRDNLKIIVKESIEKFFIKSTHPQEEIILFSKNCHKSLIEWFYNEFEFAFEK